MNLRTVSQGGYDSLRAGKDSEEAKIQDCRRREVDIESLGERTEVL